jgi:Leucine-rich repeat (LRR) protein
VPSPFLCLAGLRRPPANLPQLRSLNLSHSGVRDAFVSSGAHRERPTLPALTDLNLDSCAIGTPNISSS